MSARVDNKLSGSVVIPTSAGPSTVLSIRAEDAEIGRSVVCLAGTSQEVGIGDYNSFVRQPTGVIERLFGHGAFRVDVSGRIDAGSSWQLAAFIAHALKSSDGRLYEPLLAEPGSGPDVVIFATGTVRSIDLAVGEVGHVADKLATARPLLETERAAGRTVYVFVPRDNEEDIEPEAAAWLAAAGIDVLAVDRVDEVLATLQLPPISRAASSVRRPDRSSRPLPGLAAYGEADRDIFFGRARAREECLDIMRRAAARGRAFLLIHGRSGAGKSSLARAGLAGDVAASSPHQGVFESALMTPSLGTIGPLRALADALARLDGGRTTGDALVQALRDHEVAALRDFEQRMAPGGLRCAGLLIVDQLEELVAVPELHPDTEAFSRCLEALARGGVVWIVATIRSDFLGQLDRSPRLSRLAADDRSYRLDRPSRHDLMEIITAPAVLAGLRFGTVDGKVLLSDDLAEKAHRSPDSLPLLQIVLSRLFAEADATGLIAPEAYDRIGKFEGAVAAWADDVVQDLLDDGVRDAEIDGLLADLLSIDQKTGLGVSRHIVRSAEDPEAESHDWRLLERLAGKRLVVIDAENDVVTARLVHEVLIVHWPRLARLVERLRVLLLARDRLLKAADDWIAGGRDPADLLRGSQRLDQAREFLTQRVVPVPGSVVSLVNASVTNAEQEARRAAGLASAAERARRFKVRALGGGFALTLIATAIVGALLWNQREISRTLMATVENLDAERVAKEAALRASESDRAAKERSLQEAKYGKLFALTSNANFMINSGDVHGALNVLIEGVGEAQTAPAIPAPYAEQSMSSATSLIRQTSYKIDRTVPTYGEVTHLALSDDGSILAYAKAGQVTIHFLDTGKEETLPLGADRLMDLAVFSPEKTVIVADHEGITVWDLEARTVAHRVQRGQDGLCAWSILRGAKDPPEVVGTLSSRSGQNKILRAVLSWERRTISAFDSACQMQNSILSSMLAMDGFQRGSLAAYDKSSVSGALLLGSGDLQLVSRSLNVTVPATAFYRHTDAVALALPPRLVAARDDGWITVFSALTGRIETELPVSRQPALRVVASEGGATMAVLSAGGEIRILKNRVREELSEVTGPMPDLVDRPVTACGPGETSLEVWSRRSGLRVTADAGGLVVTDLTRTSPARRRPLPAPDAVPRALSLTPDGRGILVAYTAEANQTLMLADYRLDGDAPATSKRIGSWNRLRCASVKPDGSMIAALAPTYSEWFYIQPDGVRQQRVDRAPNFPRTIVFSPTGRLIFLLSESEFLSVSTSDGGVQLASYVVPKGSMDRNFWFKGFDEDKLYFGSSDKNYRVSIHESVGSLVEEAKDLVAYCLPTEWRVAAGLPAALPAWCSGKPPPPRPAPSGAPKE